MAVASAGPYANCLHLAPDRYPHQHLVAQFLQTRCSSWCPTNSVKALKAIRIVFFACLFQCHVNGILILLCLLFFMETGAAVITDTVWNSQLAAPILLVGKTSTVVLLFWNQPTGQYNSCTVCVRLLLHCITLGPFCRLVGAFLQAGWGLSAGYQPRPQVVDRGTTARYGGQLRYI